MEKANSFPLWEDRILKAPACETRGAREVGFDMDEVTFGPDIWQEVRHQLTEVDEDAQDGPIRCLGNENR